MTPLSIFKLGMKVRHGTYGVDNDEIIKHIIPHGHCTGIEFESGKFTYVPNTLHFDCDGKAQFYKYWQPGGCENKAYETISIIE